MKAAIMKCDYKPRRSQLDVLINGYSINNKHYAVTWPKVQVHYGNLNLFANSYVLYVPIINSQ